MFRAQCVLLSSAMNRATPFTAAAQRLLKLHTEHRTLLREHRDDPRSDAATIVPIANGIREKFERELEKTRPLFTVAASMEAGKFYSTQLYKALCHFRMEDDPMARQIARQLGKKAMTRGAHTDIGSNVAAKVRAVQHAMHGGHPAAPVHSNYSANDSVPGEGQSAAASQSFLDMMGPSATDTVDVDAELTTTAKKGKQWAKAKGGKAAKTTAAEKKKKEKEQKEKKGKTAKKGKKDTKGATAKKAPVEEVEEMIASDRLHDSAAPFRRTPLSPPSARGLGAHAHFEAASSAHSPTELSEASMDHADQHHEAFGRDMEALPPRRAPMTLAEQHAAHAARVRAVAPTGTLHGQEQELMPAEFPAPPDMSVLGDDLPEDVTKIHEKYRGHWVLRDPAIAITRQGRRSDPW